MRDLSYIKSSLITCPHGFSTRWGGVSQGIYESLNLGRPDRGDMPGNILKNWEIFGNALGIDTSRFVHGKQVHGSTVRVAGGEDAHSILEAASWEGADGYVTNIPGLPLAVFTADCAPLLLQEPKAGIVGAIHCGWRSTAADIMGEAVDKIRLLGGDPAYIRAAVGPCIHQCCFQTGPEVPAALDRLLGGRGGGLYAPDPSQQGKFLVDLPGAVIRRLLQLGLSSENIEDIGLCTKCRPETFWSHRNCGENRGSQANIIML